MDHLIQKAKKVKDQYRELNKLKGEKEWTYKDYADGFVGDVGDLIKMLQAKDNLRSYTKGNLDEDIKHELSDCLWSILVIADELNIDLETVYKSKIDELSVWVEEKIVEAKK